MPKFILVSSDDEFMSMDWTNIGYFEKLQGEKHLYIVPNTEHGLATGLFRALNAIGTFMSSVISGKTERPSIDYQYDRSSGELSVIIPKDIKPDSVKMRHGMTLSKDRRDFRWIVNANNITKIDPACKFPYVSFPKKHSLESDHGPQCLQPIIWEGKSLKQSGVTPNGDSIYSTHPPKPIPGHWTGYYIEVTFPSDTDSGSGYYKNEYHLTTPGYTWPTTLPFDDCFMDTCVGIMV